MRQATIETHITCEAGDEYFLSDPPQWVLDECEENGPIECEGRGIAEWCQGCRFCTWYETEIVDE
jgi:hypothetical protein